MGPRRAKRSWTQRRRREEDKAARTVGSISLSSAVARSRGRRRGRGGRRNSNRITSGQRHRDGARDAKRALRSARYTTGAGESTRSSSNGGYAGARESARICFGFGLLLVEGAEGRTTPLFDDLLLSGFRFNLLTSTPLAVLPFPLALNSWCVRTSLCFGYLHVLPSPALGPREILLPANA